MEDRLLSKSEVTLPESKGNATGATLPHPRFNCTNSQCASSDRAALSS